MELNSMKCIVNDYLGSHIRAINKSSSNSHCMQYMLQKVQKTAAEIKEKGLGKNSLLGGKNLFTVDDKSTTATERT